MICRHAIWTRGESVHFQRCGEEYALARCDKLGNVCCPLAPNKRQLRLKKHGIVSCAACEHFKEIDDGPNS